MGDSEENLLDFAERQAKMHILNQNCTFTFEPGAPGVILDFEAGKVREVEAGGQAERLGLKPGLVIKNVDGSDYSAELMRSRALGARQYDVIAELPEETAAEQQVANGSGAKIENLKNNRPKTNRRQHCSASSSGGQYSPGVLRAGDFIGVKSNLCDRAECTVYPKTSQAPYQKCHCEIKDIKKHKALISYAHGGINDEWVGLSEGRIVLDKDEFRCKHGRVCNRMVRGRVCTKPECKSRFCHDPGCVATSNARKLCS